MPFVMYTRYMPKGKQKKQTEGIGHKDHAIEIATMTAQCTRRSVAFLVGWLNSSGARDGCCGGGED